MASRLTLRALFFWLAPSASVGTLSVGRSPLPDHEDVTVDTMADLPSRYLNTRHTVRIFLPPDYRNGRRHYPVLLMNDGQDAEAANLPWTLDSLYRSRAIEPIIVVAVHATGDRMHEYGVAGIPNAQGLGSRARDYEKFITREILPLIRHRYRTIKSPAQTAVIGWSLGALSAFDLAWRHPDLFGRVGAFSGSFWWRTNDSTLETRQSSRVVHRIVREATRVPHIRMWFEAGLQDETDDRDGNGVLDAIQDTRELMDALAE